MSGSSNHRQRPPTSDRGAVLPLVLVIVFVLGAVVVSIATYATTSLKYGTVAESRSDRLSAADAGMRYAIDQLKLRNAGCILDTQQAVLPGVDADFNDASAAIVCERVTSGFEGIQAFAAVMTGEGLAPTDALLTSQSGSTSKILGGPVYMARIDDDAFSLTPPVQIEDGPLLYHDTTGTVPCQSKKPSELAAVQANTLVFEPELIFGPVCVTVPWTTLFDSPQVPDLTTLPVRDGTVSLTSDPIGGSFVDVSGAGGCRVFVPGRYVQPPDLDGHDAYFQTGDYVFDFAGPSQEFLVRQGTSTAGRVNPLVATTNELQADMTSRCRQEQTNDPAVLTGEYGATFYFAGAARINIATQGSLEIHAREQGADFVSVQTLCNPNGVWCNPDGDGGLTGAGSTLTAPASTANNFLFTDSGNNKEFVAQALVYAPQGQIEFGNVSNTATQKMLGGLIVSRLKLQSATSATNFEISVPTSPITAKIQLTSTAIKDTSTSIQTVVEYRPYEDDIDDRVRINSWRVCADAACN